jgi:hypothetical protein
MTTNPNFTPHSPEFSAVNPQQRAILKQVNRLAWLLDNSIYLPILNYRIGLEAIVGLVPGLGDLAGALMSSYIVLQALRLGVPKPILLRMLGNVTLEAVVGLIPFLGDFFDATFKANVRNVRLLNEFFAASTIQPLALEAPGRGVITAVVGALLSLLALTGTAGFAIFRRMLRRFAAAKAVVQASSPKTR